MTTKTFITGFALAFTLAIVGIFYSTYQSAESSGYIGWPVYLQSATTTTVGPDTVVTLFASTADCKSRVVTTNNNAVHLSFADTAGFGSTTLAVNAGHYQAASTTVAYESGIYGCGLMTALGLTASGTVTTSNY